VGLLKKNRIMAGSLETFATPIQFPCGMKTVAPVPASYSRPAKVTRTAPLWTNMTSSSCRCLWVGILFPGGISSVPTTSASEPVLRGSTLKMSLCELSPGRHHRDPESERLETRRTHSAHERRGWHGLGAFRNEFSGFRHAVTPEWSGTLTSPVDGRVARHFSR
jgi:hypothetical protein